MNVYQLAAIHAEAGETRPDGSIPTFERDLGVFSTVSNAETMMRVYSGGDWTPWAYILKGRILDDVELHGHFKQTSEFRSVRSYFANGTLNAENGCDDTGEKLWYGRDADTIRHKIGDCVSFWHGGELLPGIVGGLPMTKEAFMQGRCGLEANDDCYLVYTPDGGHCHPFTPYVFPLVGKLPEDVKNKLTAAR